MLSQVQALASETAANSAEEGGLGLNEIRHMAQSLKDRYVMLHALEDMFEINLMSVALNKCRQFTGC